MQSVQRSLNLLFQHTLFLMFSLFEKYRNPQVRTKKLANSVFYHPCPSRLASGICPYFFKLLRVLPLSRMLVEFSDLYIPPCVGKSFQYMVFTFENSLNLCIFTHCPVLHLELQVQFFENLFPLRAKNNRAEETMIYFIKIQSENMKMTWNISLFSYNLYDL